MSSCSATELTKLAGTESKLLLELLTKGRKGMVTGNKCNLCNVLRTHPQLPLRVFQAHTPNGIIYFVALAALTLSLLAGGE